MSNAGVEHISAHESARCEALLRGLLARVGSRCAFVYSLEQHWLPEAESVELIVVAESVASEADQGTTLRVVIGRGPEYLPGEITTDSLEQVAHQLDAALFDLARPWVLEPVEVAKPWGREIWFTGVEARGVCSVVQGAASVPIPWLIQVCGSLVVGAAESKLVLLKILDPLPEEVFGDLYVELHERKQEVYVVTRVDRTAWPDGVGAIRFGFNQSLVAKYNSADAFRSGYIDAVESYRAVRVEIDRLLDVERQRRDIGLNEPVTAHIQQQWLSVLPSELLQREAILRAQMDTFYGSLPLRVGDVIKVPCHVPHSLQHGVTTIEFQTPVYERRILSFAQKVLTQSHWDTREAMALCDVGPVEPGALELILAKLGMKIERIVDFDSFEVFRLALSVGVEVDLTELFRCSGYLIVMVVSGTLLLHDTRIEALDAVLLGAMSVPFRACATESDAVVVVANPKSPAVY